MSFSVFFLWFLWLKSIPCSFYFLFSVFVQFYLISFFMFFLPDLSQFYKLYYCMVLRMLELVTTFCLMMIRHDEQKKKSWCRVNVLGQLKCFVICYLMEISLLPTCFFFLWQLFQTIKLCFIFSCRTLSGCFFLFFCFVICFIQIRITWN